MPRNLAVSAYNIALLFNIIDEMFVCRLAISICLRDRFIKNKVKNLQRSNRAGIDVLTVIVLNSFYEKTSNRKLHVFYRLSCKISLYNMWSNSVFTDASKKVGLNVKKTN